MAEQRVTDEQPLDLDAFEARATGSPLDRAAALIGVDVPQLIAEVRASRTREAELRDQLRLANLDQVNSEAEQDVLQQRIDKVLAMCDAADTDQEPRLLHVGLLDPRTVRAALTGTEPDRA